MKHLQLKPQELHEESSRTPRDRFLEDQVETGAYRARRLSRTRVWDFSMIWMFRSRAEAEHTLAVWHEVQHRAFTFDWLDGKRYEALFSQAVQTREHAYEFFRVEMHCMARLAR